MPELTHLCRRDDLAPDSVRRFEIGAHVVALIRIGDEFFAIDDTCSHEDYSLSEGEILADECELQCPKHGSTFDLRTGEPRSLPATKAVAVYKVHQHGEDITLELP